MPTEVFATTAGEVVARLFPDSYMGRTLLTEARERAEDEASAAAMEPFVALYKAIRHPYVDRIHDLWDRAYAVRMEMQDTWEGGECHGGLSGDVAANWSNLVWWAEDVELIHVIALSENVMHDGARAAKAAIEALYV